MKVTSPYLRPTLEWSWAVDRVFRRVSQILGWLYEAALWIGVGTIALHLTAEGRRLDATQALSAPRHALTRVERSVRAKLPATLSWHLGQNP